MQGRIRLQLARMADQLGHRTLHVSVFSRLISAGFRRRCDTQVYRGKLSSEFGGQLLHRERPDRRTMKARRSSAEPSAASERWCLKLKVIAAKETGPGCHLQLMNAC